LYRLLIFAAVLPITFIQSIQSVKGFKQKPFEAVHASEKQLTSVRINPAKNFSSIDVINNASQVHWCEHGFYLPLRPSFTFDPQFHAGMYYVQEASSMFLWHVLKQTIANPEQKKVLDLCAAPGGKTTLLSSFFTQGIVVSNEVIKSRANILVENVTKWGSENIVVTNNDPSHFKSLENFFDVIVIDAPCSGSGMFRKDKDAIKEWSLGNVVLCSHRQQRIVADVLPSLKKDGLLIYSTCSYSKEENEDMVDWLMTTFELETVCIPIDTSWGIVESESEQTHGYGYRFYPDQVEGEGFFIAALKKIIPSSEKKYKEQAIALPVKNEVQILQSFISLPEQFTLFKHDTQIRMLQQLWLQDLKIIAGTLYIKKAGICIGEIKGKDVVPHHELALSTLDLKDIPVISLNKEDALQYLRKNDISVDASNGWNIVKYGVVRLGWMKVMPNRMNNYYPAEWKILKQ
jgi:NOL1/NOP2/sun family putative RNA methylase